MLNMQKTVRLRARRIHRLIPDILAPLDQSRVVEKIPLGVQVEVYDVVTQLGEGCFAGRLADGVRWSTPTLDLEWTIDSGASRDTNRMYVGNMPRMSLNAISFQRIWSWNCAAVMALAFSCDHVWLATWWPSATILCDMSARVSKTNTLPCLLSVKTGTNHSPGYNPPKASQDR